MCPHQTLFKRLGRAAHLSACRRNPKRFNVAVTRAKGEPAMTNPALHRLCQFKLMRFCAAQQQRLMLGPWAALSS